MNNKNDKELFDRSKLKSYYFIIKTITPLHIGTGEVYEPTNFVIDDNKIFCFDEILLYQSLKLQDRENLERKMADYMQVVQFYKQDHIKSIGKKIAFFETQVSQKVQDQYNKSFNKDGSQNKNQFAIDNTFKNASTFDPIIPGSSIKGMLDTILKIYSKPEASDNNTRQHLLLSDALCLTGSTEIIYTDRKYKDTNKATQKPISTIVEAIVPQSEFVVKIQSTYDLEKLQKDNQNYYKQRKNTGTNQEFKALANGFRARLGKYSGMEYVVYDIKDAKNKNGDDVATHMVDEKNQAFGWVEFQSIEEEQYNDYINKIQKRQKQYFSDLEQKQQAIRTKNEKLMQAKAEAQRQKALADEQQRQEQMAQEKAEQERLASLSPLQQEIEKLKQKDPNTPLPTLLFSAIKNGQFDDNCCEALQYLKKLMQEAKKWKETTTAKKPKKDKDYQKTLEIMELLKNC